MYRYMTIAKWHTKFLYPRYEVYRGGGVYSFAFFIPRRSRWDIVLASSIRPHFCLSGTISQYLLVRFDSFLVQMISTMDSRYPLSLVKIDPLTLELLPLFSICNYMAKPILAFFCVVIFTFHQSYYIEQLLTIDHDCQVPVD